MSKILNHPHHKCHGASLWCCVNPHNPSCCFNSFKSNARKAYINKCPINIHRPFSNLIWNVHPNFYRTLPSASFSPFPQIVILVPVAKFSPHKRNNVALLSSLKPPIMHQTNSPTSSLGKTFLTLTRCLLSSKISHFPFSITISSSSLLDKFFSAIIWFLPFLSQYFYFSFLFPNPLCYLPNQQYLRTTPTIEQPSE